MKEKNGIIELDSKFGKQLGFTSDKFDGWLWKKGNYIYISFIESLQPGKGNLSKLFSNILKAGYGIKVPTPLGSMEAIVRKKGFRQIYEWSNTFGENVEVWVRNKEVIR